MKSFHTFYEASRKSARKALHKTMQQRINIQDRMKRDMGEAPKPIEYPPDIYTALGKIILSKFVTLLNKTIPGHTYIEVIQGNNGEAVQVWHEFDKFKQYDHAPKIYHSGKHRIENGKDIQSVVVMSSHKKENRMVIYSRIWDVVSDEEDSSMDVWDRIKSTQYGVLVHSFGFEAVGDGIESEFIIDDITPLVNRFEDNMDLQAAWY